MRPVTLLVYAKPARIGLSKTRLAKGLGRTEARRVAGFTLARTLRAARMSGCRVVLFVSPDTMAHPGPVPPGFGGSERRAQGQGGLTERLERGLRAAPPGPVMFIGADAPDVTPGRLRRAVALLRRSDAVFGPADDGGFWLFGLHKGPSTRAPFRNVRWSGPHAMQDVWSHLPPHNRIGLLETLIDIDEASDWKAWTRRKR